MSSFSDTILKFYFGLKKFPVPDDVEIMNPYEEQAVRTVVSSFYDRFYNDYGKRYFIIGINPGRFGGGITGIPFTDPIRLLKECNISHDFALKPELSSDFIYRMIKTYGGAEKFFSRYFLTAVNPLGFVSKGKNMNYYDSRELLQATDPFIRNTLPQQMSAGAVKKVAFCLGEGTNFRHLAFYNEKLGLFDSINPLPHPRWVMQYRRKSLDIYIEKYINAFNSVG